MNSMNVGMPMNPTPANAAAGGGGKLPKKNGFVGGVPATHKAAAKPGALNQPIKVLTRPKPKQSPTGPDATIALKKGPSDLQGKEVIATKDTTPTEVSTLSYSGGGVAEDATVSSLGSGHMTAADSVRESDHIDMETTPTLMGYQAAPSSAPPPGFMDPTLSATAGGLSAIPSGMNPLDIDPFAGGASGEIRATAKAFIPNTFKSFKPAGIMQHGPPGMGLSQQQQSQQQMQQLHASPQQPESYAMPSHMPMPELSPIGETLASMGPPNGTSSAGGSRVLNNLGANGAMGLSGVGTTSNAPGPFSDVPSAASSITGISMNDEAMALSGTNAPYAGFSLEPPMEDPVGQSLLDRLTLDASDKNNTGGAASDNDKNVDIGGGIKLSTSGGAGVGVDLSQPQRQTPSLTGNDLSKESPLLQTAASIWGGSSSGTGMGGNSQPLAGLGSGLPSLSGLGGTGLMGMSSTLTGDGDNTNSNIVDSGNIASGVIGGGNNNNSNNGTAVGNNGPVWGSDLNGGASSAGGGLGSIW